jgi:hypothetical protein
MIVAPKSAGDKQLRIVCQSKIGCVGNYYQEQIRCIYRHPTSDVIFDNKYEFI